MMYYAFVCLCDREKFALGGNKMKNTKENEELIELLSNNNNNVETSKEICQKSPLITIPAVEKTVTAGGFDLMVVCPCTGNTLAKLSNGITDGPVSMGVKAMLRNKKPIVIAFASNDGLSGSLKNIAALLERKNFFFVPLRQDDFVNKPSSLVCDFSLVEQTISVAMGGKQLQPILLPPLKKEEK